MSLASEIAPGFTSPPKTDERVDPRVWKTAGVVLLGPLMTQVDSTVVNFSLAAIRDDLGATLSAVHWIISGYLLALALMLPLNGWLVDRLGPKRVYLGCFAGFTLASLLCGAARTIDQLIWARVLQGMAGGLLAPMTQMMLARIAGRNFARVVGITTVPVLLAPLLGPSLAGLILHAAGWPWLFFINLPIGALALGLAWWHLPADEPTIAQRPFDARGFLLISPGLVLTLFGLERVNEVSGLVLLATGAALLALFVRDALAKRERALVDVRLFSGPIFRTAAAVTFLMNGVIYAGQMLVPLYLIKGCGFSAAKSGVLLVPVALGMLVVAPLLGVLTERFGNRAVSSSGVTINTLGTLPFLWMIYAGFSPALMILGGFLRGAGSGMTGVPCLAAAYASVPRDKLAVATTAINVVQRLGGPLATTLLAFILSAYGTADARAFVVPFVALIALQVGVLRFARRL